MKRLAMLTTICIGLTTTAVAAASAGPGKFTSKLTGKSAKTEGGKLDGTWTIDLASSKSGKLNLTWNGKNNGGGTYSISGSTITFTPKKGGSCKGTAKYHFKHSGSKLTFTKISDSCTVRVDVLTFGVWKKATGSGLPPGY